MAKHAKLSASGSKRYLTCPGSIPLVDDLPAGMRSGTNPAAQTGTCAHALGEHCLQKGLRTSEKFVGHLIFIDPSEDATLVLTKPTKAQAKKLTTLQAVQDFKKNQDIVFYVIVDEHMSECVDVYLDAVWERFEEMGPDVTEMSVERGFDLSWLRPEMFGTADCCLYQFMGRLSVIDYKNGRVGVEVKNNTQGMYYALGMAHEVDWLFEEVEIVIVQPNSAHSDGHVRKWIISKAELEEFRDYLAAGYDTVQEAIKRYDWVDDEASLLEWQGEFLNAGDDGEHCTYCDAFTSCPAARAKAQEVAKLDFSGCNEDPEEKEVELNDASPQALRELEEVLKWTPFLDRYVKAAAALAEKRLNAGKPVPGYKLVSGRANRSFAQDEDELLKALKPAGVKKADLYTKAEPKLKSPAQMERISKEAKKLVAGVWDKENNCWEVPPLASKGQGKPTVVPDSDPRAPLKMSAADDFADDLD